ncbi:hypothetical protein [Planctomycetes bacterium K23_9]|uniref:Uncharacterized protein n=1 Tax=Stieleria marina TaxID=1930275 RepID=A0A517P3H3_9BACT|nr:hypothetical protein K239x_59450 [Planctomycetes bacterium K23_9]
MTTPESRCYTHKKCSAETEVSGPEFHAMSDPLAGMNRTFCSQCEDMFSIDEFVWTDTGESIPDYYQRHGRKASDTDRMLCSNQGLLALGGAGLFIGFMIGTAVCLTIGGLTGIFIAAFLALVGAVGGVIFREAVVTPKILQRVCGVSDTRQLK